MTSARPAARSCGGGHVERAVDPPALLRAQRRAGDGATIVRATSARAAWRRASSADAGAAISSSDSRARAGRRRADKAGHATRGGRRSATVGCDARFVFYLVRCHGRLERCSRDSPSPQHLRVRRSRRRPRCASSRPGSPPPARWARIAGGPDGNLWFTERGGDRIGRITPDRRRHRVLDRHHRRQRPDRASPPAPTATSGSPRPAATGSAGSRRPATSPSSRPASPPAASPRASPPAPTATSGSPSRRRPDRADHAGRRRHRVPAGITADSAPVRHRGRPRRQPLVHRVDGNRIGRITPDRRRSPSSRAGITAGSEPVRHHRRPRRQPLVHRERRQPDRADHPGRRRSPSSRAGITAGSGPIGIAAGPDGNLWFTEAGGDRIGRITPAGAITEFTAGITAGSGPFGITAGPDGNLWFTEIDGNRIGRITTGQPPPRFTDAARIEVPASRHDVGTGGPVPGDDRRRGPRRGRSPTSACASTASTTRSPATSRRMLVGPQGQSALLVHNATNRPGDVTTPGRRAQRPGHHAQGRRPSRPTRPDERDLRADRRRLRDHLPGPRTRRPRRQPCRSSTAPTPTARGGCSSHDDEVSADAPASSPAAGRSTSRPPAPTPSRSPDPPSASPARDLTVPGPTRTVLPAPDRARPTPDRHRPRHADAGSPPSAAASPSASPRASRSPSTRRCRSSRAARRSRRPACRSSSPSRPRALTTAAHGRCACAPARALLGRPRRTLPRPPAPRRHRRRRQPHHRHPHDHRHPRPALKTPALNHKTRRRRAL